MRQLNFLLVLVLLPLIGISQWSDNPAINNRITDMAGEQVIPKVAICPNGDVYVGYFSSEIGNYNVRLQRLDHQGNILWANNGILVSSNPSMTWLTDWDMTADNENYAILTWQDIRSGGNNNTVAYRISPDGDFVWGANGIMLSNSTAFDVSPKVTVTASNNAVFAWQSDNVIIRQKISPDGVKQWGENGITISGINRFSWPQLMPVGEDDVIMKYFEDSGPVNAPTRHVLAQRFTSDGSGVWTAPTVVSNAGGISAWTQIFPFINDGNDGFYIAWHDDRDFNNQSSSFVQHIDANGTPTMAANGVEVSTNSSYHHFYPQLSKPANDPHIYVFWNEVNVDQNQWGIYAQKVSEAGDLKWTTSGKSIIPVTTHAVLPQQGLQHGDDMILIYEDYFNGVETALKALRLDANGNFVWTGQTVFICSVQSSKVHLDVSKYDQTQWVLAWEDDRISSNKDIYAQNFLPTGEVGPAALNGTISGTITLENGSNDVSLTEISAGDVSAFADADGNYSLEIGAGTYAVTATHPYAVTETLENIEVIEGATTTADFVLTIDKTDLTVRAVDQFNHPLYEYGIAVEYDITGPDGNHVGIFNADTMIIATAPYGEYTGTASFDTYPEPVEAIATIDAETNELIFVFIIGGLHEQKLRTTMSVVPNPVNESSKLFIQSAVAQKADISIIDAGGNALLTAGGISLRQGMNEMNLSDFKGFSRLSNGVYYLHMRNEISRSSLKLVVVK